MTGEKSKHEMLSPFHEEKDRLTSEQAAAFNKSFEKAGLKDEDLSELKAAAEKEEMEEMGEEIDETVELLDKALKGRPDSVEKTHFIDTKAEEKIAEEFGPGEQGFEKAAETIKDKIMKEINYLKKLSKTASKEELAAIEKKLESRLVTVKRIDGHLTRVAKQKLERVELGKKQSQAQEQQEATKKPARKGLLARFGLGKKK